MMDGLERKAKVNPAAAARLARAKAAQAAQQQPATTSGPPYPMPGTKPPDGAYWDAEKGVFRTGTAPTPPAPTPTAPANQTGPQVIVYGEDAWKSNPTTQFLNGQLGYDQFNTLSSLSTTDPATGSYIQAPRQMNAAVMMAIARDPVRLGMIKAQMTRMNRDWDKEFADALAAGPSGNAHGYYRTG